MSEEIEVLHGEKCPMCLKDTLTLRQMEREVPFFGNVIIFSMTCEDEKCGYHQSDVESEEEKGPIKCSFKVESEEDMKVRVIKSSSATIKIGRVGNIEPGSASNGYVTNIEGILNRMKKTLENVRDSADDNTERKKAKNHIKKLTKVIWGQDSIDIKIEDPSGNSAIVSEKAEYK